MSEDQDERREMVADFVTESREMLDDIEPQILALEKHASNSGDIDDEILNTIFRLFHSLKGMASFLDLQTVIHVTHEAETLLDIFRKRQMPIETEHVDLLCRTSDFIRTLLEVIEQRLTDDGFEEAAEKIVGEIQIRIENGKNGCENSKISDKAEPVCESAQSLSVTERTEEIDVVQNEDVVDFSLTITPEMMKRFLDEAADIFEEAESTLLQMELRPHDHELVEQVFRSFHSFKGNAGFFGFADFEKLSHKAESLLDAIREGENEATPAMISVLLSVVDVLRVGMSQVEQGRGGKIAEMEKIIHSLEQLEAPIEINTETIITFEEMKAEVEDFEPESEAEPMLLESTAKKAAGDPPARKDEAEKKQNGAGQVALRVDVEKLDQLLDLVGEMVISVSMVSNSPDLAGLSLDRFEKSMMHLTKITRDIQDVSMSMRMIPLSGMFRKMVRLVRDVAMKENKKVDLEIIGEETEVDKTIIEQISDPLVHLMRNAVDHGIETVEQRVSLGKSPRGVVEITASYDRGMARITISDDGAGIPVECLARKAVDKRLISEDEAQRVIRYNNADAIADLVFTPGLSSAQIITDFSGRGVGMDIVHENIVRSLHGSVSVATTKGKGSTFTIHLPLNTAILQATVFRIGAAHLAVPTHVVSEVVRLDRSSRIEVVRSQALRVREQIVPVLQVGRLFNLDRGSEQASSNGGSTVLALLVRTSAGLGAVLVDDLIDQGSFLIHALPGYLGRTPWVSGCIVGTHDRVVLLVNTHNLMEHARQAGQEVREPQGSDAHRGQV